MRAALVDFAEGVLLVALLVLFAAAGLAAIYVTFWIIGAAPGAFVHGFCYASGVCG